MDKLEETAREILKTYEFGRFVKFLERADLLMNTLLDDKKDYGKSNNSAKSIIDDFILFDQSRFKDAVEWALKREGNFPDMWMRRRHMNLLFDLNDSFAHKQPFYVNAPLELKKSAEELHETAFTFYRLDRRPGSQGGSEYHYRGTDLLNDCEKAIVLARRFLDLGYNYLKEIYSER